MKPVQTKVEVITPEIAAQYLKRNKQNRPLRQHHVDRLASEMRAGRWLVTHQGIAFDENGILIDGQHRLAAVVASGASPRIMVTRGVQEKVNGSVNLFTMDVIDCGRTRSTADQLNLTHGVANSNLTAAACRMIAVACTENLSLPAPSVGQAVRILAVYGAAIDAVIKAGKNSMLIKNAAVVATLALGYAIDKTLALEFADSIATGENIKRGEPVYAIREALINRGSDFRTYPGRYRLMQMVGNAFYNALRGAELKRAKSGVQGLEYILRRQKESVTNIHSVFTDLVAAKGKN